MYIHRSHYQSEYFSWYQSSGNFPWYDWWRGGLFPYLLIPLWDLPSVYQRKLTLVKKHTIHQVTTMLTTFKKSYCQVITTFDTYATLSTSADSTVHFDYCLSASRTFLEVVSIVVTWWTVALFRQCTSDCSTDIPRISQGKHVGTK